MVKAVKGGCLIDGCGGLPLDNPVILIEDGKIKEIGCADTVAIPEGAEVLDLSGKTILPGMIDAHVHIGSNGEASYELQGLKELIPYKALKAAVNARKALEAGFTTLRDMGEARSEERRVG